LLEPVRKMGELISVPNLLLSNSWLGDANAKKRQRVEETILKWFQLAGFDGDLSRFHFYGDPQFSGYHGLLRELDNPPPWINDITTDEGQGDITVARAKELTPLYLQVGEHDDLERKFEDYLREKYFVKSNNDFIQHILSLLNERIPEEIRDEASGATTVGDFLRRHQSEHFYRVLHLARTIQPASFPQVLESIIDTIRDDECGDIENVSVGSPDVLLWTMSPLPPFWFFAEVKGPNDRLRESQIGWIRANWERIKGRVLLISISND